jgi:predicted phage terminase large subunit-like protein
MLLRLRQLNQAQTIPPFDDWLPLVSPEWDWQARHLAYIRQHLDKVTTGQCDRLMIFLPPRHGKSEMVTVRYAAWRLERNPGQRVIIGAYNQLLAEKFSRKVRRIAKSRVALSTERTAVLDWETAAGGGLRAVGVGGGITGMGGDLIIIDDPVKSREEANSEAYRERCWDWYTDDLFTRREPHAAMILIMTRWHDDDLAGRILASEDGPKWQVVSLPAEAHDDDVLGRKPGEALWPERYPIAVLSEIRGVLQSEYHALYQQEPLPESGVIFLREWFERPTDIVDRIGYDLVIQAWDTAYEEGKENDYSACVTIGRRRNLYYVLDAWRARLAFPQLVEAIKEKAAQFEADGILVEGKASGKSAVQSLRQSTRLPIVEVPAEKDKVARANVITPTCEAKRVHIPAGAYGDLLLGELLRFPSGKHDDLVDAFVHAMKRMTVGVTHRARVREY